MMTYHTLAWLQNLEMPVLLKPANAFVEFHGRGGRLAEAGAARSEHSHGALSCFDA